jgi:hypothetical protein
MQSLGSWTAADLIFILIYETLRISRSYTSKILYRKFETYISRKETTRPPVPIPTFTFLWAIYIFLWCCGLFWCSFRIGGPNVGIYRSLTDTWMCKLGLRPRAIPFLGIHKFKFLCSVVVPRGDPSELSDEPPWRLTGRRLARLSIECHLNTETYSHTDSFKSLLHKAYFTLLYVIFLKRIKIFFPLQHNIEA